MNYDVCYCMAIEETGQRLRLRRTGRVPPDARVRHYDELDEDAQELVRKLAEKPQTAPGVGDLEDGEFVKFTGYYQVRTR